MSEDLPYDYADFPLGYTRVDWDDPTVTADSVTKILIGSDPWDYWDLPEYEGMSPWEVERQLLFDIRRPNWGGNSKHGKPYYQHMLTLAKLMFPEMDVTPAVHDTFAFFCFNLGGNGRKGLHLIGSQNAGKSFGSCLLSFVTMYIDPHYTAIFVANPFDKSSESQAWGTIKELWFELKEAHPNNTGKGLSDACSLFPWAKIYADRYIELIPGLPKAGAIRLQSVKHEGKFRGIKAFGKDVTRGVVLLIVDEINLIDNHAFISMIDNLASQDAYQSISSQNYREADDLGGRVTEPSGYYGGAKTIDDLDIDRDQWWHSVKSTVTLRFDGHLSPNILADRTIYPKLFKKENMQRLKEGGGGDQSPAYYSQCRSFPVRGAESNSVLSRAKVSSSRHLDPYFSLKHLDGAVSFVDPAFGGRDGCVWGCAYFGEGVVTDADGEQRDQPLVVFKDHFHRLKLVKDAKYNDYWIERMKAAGIDVSSVVEGADVSYEDQTAIQTKELNRSHGVPDANTGYDFSMRPDIVSSMNKYVGFAAHAFDYNQKPEGCFLQSIKQQSEDCCKNRCTELAMLTADLFLTKQVRGGNFIESAITQLSRTLLESVNKKFVAEGKREYKARWNNASPDHRDVLMGLAGMAQRKGFRRNTVGPGKVKSAWAELNARNKGKSKIGKRI